MNGLTLNIIHKDGRASITMKKHISSVLQKNLNFD